MKPSTTATGVRVARQPATRGEKRARVVGMGLMLVGMAYVFWCRATDSGIVGWLDALQARGRGRYDETLSFIVAMVCVAVPAFAVAMPLARIGRGARQPLRPNPATMGEMLAAQSRVALVVGLGMIALYWAGGFGAYEYFTGRARAEMQATYETVDVAAPTVASSRLRFVALTGRVHPSGYLKRTENNEQDGTFFIPIVARAARDPGVPVHWVVRADGSVAPSLPPTIRGHVTGETMPQTIRDAFERDGTKIAPDAILVSYVATDGTGAVLDPTRNYLKLFVGGCAVLSVVTLMMIAAYWLKLRLARRRLAAA